MIITWNMPAGLPKQTASSTGQRPAHSFHGVPQRGCHEKTNTLPFSCVHESPVFDLHTGGVYPFQTSLPVDRVIFCPTHKYKRKGSEKSTPIPHADILNLPVNFVIFEQFPPVFLCKRQKPSPTRGEGRFFICFYWHRNCATSGRVTTEMMVETKAY